MAALITCAQESPALLMGPGDEPPPLPLTCAQESPALLMDPGDEPPPPPPPPPPAELTILPTIMSSHSLTALPFSSLKPPSSGTACRYMVT